MERMIETLAPLGEAEAPAGARHREPPAAAVSDRLRNLVIYALASRYEVDAVETQRRGHATEICARRRATPTSLSSRSAATAP